MKKFFLILFLVLGSLLSCGQTKPHLVKYQSQKAVYISNLHHPEDGYPAKANMHFTWVKVSDPTKYFLICEDKDDNIKSEWSFKESDLKKDTLMPGVRV